MNYVIPWTGEIMDLRAWAVRPKPLADRGSLAVNGPNLKQTGHNQATRLQPGEDSNPSVPKKQPGERYKTHEEGA